MAVETSKVMQDFLIRHQREFAEVFGGNALELHAEWYAWGDFSEVIEIFCGRDGRRAVLYSHNEVLDSLDKIPGDFERRVREFLAGRDPRGAVEMVALSGEAAAQFGPLVGVRVTSVQRRDPATEPLAGFDMTPPCGGLRIASLPSSGPVGDGIALTNIAHPGWPYTNAVHKNVEPLVSSSGWPGTAQSETIVGVNVEVARDGEAEDDSVNKAAAPRDPFDPKNWGL